MRTIISLVIILLLPLTVFAGEKHGKFTKHYDESLFKVTEKGLFSIEMVIKDKELKVGENKIDLILHDEKDKDLVGADITITPWMPGMGHGVREVPEIMEKGGGLYSVENLVFSMKGHWELRITVTANGTEDRAVFSFAGVGTGHAHKMQKHTPSDLDTATTQMSANKMYTVTYESQLDPIVVNKLHTVKLKITTAEGAPVTGADIDIDGDMPAHGHGLPTEPEVTQELGEGYYLVEGMKFSMPGHWVISIEIEKGKEEDKATFNLNLK
jgi:hypothetical protein